MGSLGVKASDRGRAVIGGGLVVLRGLPAFTSGTRTLSRYTSVDSSRSHAPPRPYIQCVCCKISKKTGGTREINIINSPPTPPSCCSSQSRQDCSVLTAARLRGARAAAAAQAGPLLRETVQEGSVVPRRGPGAGPTSLEEERKEEKRKCEGGGRKRLTHAVGECSPASTFSPPSGRVVEPGGWGGLS